MATPEASSSTRVSQAAKRAAKTETFSKSLHIALSIFDDEVTTLSDVRETAYKNFIVAYKTAFTDIWPKNRWSGYRSNIRLSQGHRATSTPTHGRHALPR